MVASMMSSLFVALFALVASSFRARAALQVEILALRMARDIALQKTVRAYWPQDKENRAASESLRG
jgi:sensor histidine kinase regulating citrate/malate metabolism